MEFDESEEAAMRVCHSRPLYAEKAGEVCELLRWYPCEVSGVILVRLLVNHRGAIPPCLKAVPATRKWGRPSRDHSLWGCQRSVPALRSSS